MIINPAEVPIPDDGINWRVAGFIPQNGEFQPDESQVRLSFVILNTLGFFVLRVRVKMFQQKKGICKTAQGTSLLEVLYGHPDNLLSNSQFSI